MRYEFREALSSEDFEGVRRLNHRVFAEEIGQHEAQPNGLLRDGFEDKSRFWLALRGRQVVGMVAVHDQPPYSIEKRLADPSVLATIEGRKLEVRLLAVEPGHRNRMVFAGLLGHMIVDAMQGGYDVLLISGVAERAEMYHRMGFVDMGPARKEGAALFIPMMLRVAKLSEEIQRNLALWRRRTGV